MVLFKCNTCSASVMHRDVGKHVGKCPGPLSLKCVDCSDTFFGRQYEMHNNCSARRTQEISQRQEVTSKVVNGIKNFEENNGKGNGELCQPVAGAKKGNEERCRPAAAAKKPKTPKKKNGKKVKKVNEKKKNKGDKQQRFKVLSGQWEQAAINASKDPSFKKQQRSLMKIVSKQVPTSVMNNTIKRTLFRLNKKWVDSLHRTEFIQEMLKMIEQEFKNINGAENKDVTELTSNQKMIGSILSASETPGLSPCQKSLLTSLTKKEKSRVVKEYAQVAWDKCLRRSESQVNLAFHKFAVEFSKLRGVPYSKRAQKRAKSKANVVERVNGTEEEQQTNGDKGGKAKEKRKQEKQKKEVEGEMLENGLGGAQEQRDLEIGNSGQESKKRKHKGEMKNGDLLTNNLADVENGATTRKGKERKKDKPVRDSELSNEGADDISEEVPSKKGKRDRASEATNGIDSGIVAEQKLKKKKRSCQEEAEQRKRSKTVEA